MRRWAEEKYNLYVQNFILNEEVLPTWLRDLSPAVIKNIVKREYKKVEDNETLPSNIIAAYEKYSIGFYDGIHFEQYEAACKGSSILKHLGEFSQDTLRTYLQFRYKLALRGRTALTREDESIILAHIHQPLSSELIDLANKLNQLNSELDLYRARGERKPIKQEVAPHQKNQEAQEQAKIHLENTNQQYKQAYNVLQIIHD
jgi:hypothetical protein